ncbi:MAG TPA: GNAT family N-acetyltransferase [Thermomicrobiales bacterium]|nr:GNAT family N-acetyltransferase [Thermomicrobiales bacterium]
MTIQVETLFRHDPAGRLTTVNEPGGGPAPRLFLGRTAAGNVWRLRHDLPLALAAELSGILADESPLGDPRQPAVTYERLVAALEAVAPVERVWDGPAWWIPEGVDMRCDITPIVVDDPALLRDGFPGWARDLAAASPCVAVVVDGAAVAVCCSARTSPRASEAGVETLERYRGRGYASAVVAAWAAKVRRAGRLPLYSTSWPNVASQAVARRLGLRFYGVDLHIT